jgi:hypothetical protein
MSMYRGHLVGGLIFYTFTVVLVSVWQDALVYSIPGLLATLAGSLFPDIDVRSTGQNLFLKVLLLIVALCLFLQASLPLTLLLIFSVLPLVMPHRGLFHNLYFIVVLVALCTGSLLYSMPASWRSIIFLAGYFLLGVLSHLILDKGMRRTFHHSR